MAIERLKSEGTAFHGPLSLVNSKGQILYSFGDEFLNALGDLTTEADIAAVGATYDQEELNLRFAYIETILNEILATINAGVVAGEE